MHISRLPYLLSQILVYKFCAVGIVNPLTDQIVEGKVRNVSEIWSLNTFTAKIDHSRFNNSFLRLPASTLVDVIFQSRSFSLGGKRVQQLQYI
jgi:hypothetical protein